MKPKVYSFVLLSSLMMCISSCMDYSQAGSTESAQENQLNDGQIINIMMTVDKGEIAFAQNGLKKNLNIQVNRYAKYLVHQHKRNLETLIQLTKQWGLEPLESVISNSLITQGKQSGKAYDELQENELDMAFVDAMIKDHQAGLKLIDTQLLPQAKNPQLKIFVEQFRAMVSNHLEKGLEMERMLQNIQKY